MNVRLVVKENNQWNSYNFPMEDAIPALNLMGFPQYGTNNNPAQRAELQGAPKFEGLLGPMWDGDAIRYENAEAYKALSAD